jgi:cytochrome P450
MSEWKNYFTFDVISQLGMRGAWGFLEKGGDVNEVITSVHGGSGVLFQRFYVVTAFNRSLVMSSMGYVPLKIWWFWNPLSRWALESLGGEKLNAFPNFLKWLTGRIVDRMGNGPPSNRKDMLQHFIEMKMQSNSQPATKDDILVEAVIVLDAGADTTAIAILAVLGALITHPEILPRLQLEIDEAYMRLGIIQNDGISYNEAIKLPYLSSVIRESMRLHPSLSSQLPRYAPAGGIQIGNHFLPEGTHVGISPTAMNRSKEIFGQNAEDFVPERV